MITARKLAFDRLVAIESEKAFAGFASKRGDDPREERIAHEYVAGITRWRRRLDFLIDSFYSGKPEGLELPMRVILRIGFYDLLVMSTPDHAAVHEAVELAKSELRKGAGNLANALMRSLLRSGDTLPTPDPGDTVAKLGILHSHPDWMVKRWLDRFEAIDVEELLVYNNRRPEYAVRVNRLRSTPNELRDALTEMGIAFREGRSSDFVFVSELAELLRSSQFGAGQMSIQDEAAGMVVQLLGPQPGETIVDICAAPGGKAMYAAEMMKNEGSVIAIDHHAGRLNLVGESATRLGCTIVKSVLSDATKALPVENADRVLVDAPCSGLGVLAKRADLRWRMTEIRLAELLPLQAAILDAAALAVRPGGTLVYSTCTTEPEENQEQVLRFLNQHPEFKLVPAFLGDDNDELIDDHGFYRSLPHKHVMDGAFAAKMVRDN